MVPEANSTDLKIGALLKDFSLDKAAYKSLDRVVSLLVEAIKEIPDQEVSSDTAASFVQDLQVPAKKVGFTFRCPESFRIVGSHSTASIVKHNVNVDLLIRMPKGCFHEKDYLDHRYHAKRCLYLCVIQKSLSSCSLVTKIGWSSFENESRKPVLVVYPVVEHPDLSGSFIRLIPSATSLFNASRLNLSRSNVRVLNQDGASRPTPKYNSSILEDMFLEANAEFINDAFLQWNSLQDALILLKVWASQRSSIYAHDCLNGYILSGILAHLASEPKGYGIDKSMNALQIFRVALKFIASKALESGIFTNPSQKVFSKQDSNEYLQAFGVVIFDASGKFNMAFRMKRTVLSELIDEAARTLNCISKFKDGWFEEIFMTKIDFAAKFDSCLRINLRKNTSIWESGFCLDEECWRTCEDNIISLLQLGLSDRVKYVRAIWRNRSQEWNVQDGLSAFNSGQMLVGLSYTSVENYCRVVDVGPSAENKEEVIKFRKFWGEKAELRRFKDGNIAESCVWDYEPWRRHLIVKNIVEHVICKHFALSKEDVNHAIDQLDFCLHVGGKDCISSSKNLLEAFEVLSNRLRLLDDIPLKVTSVQPLDPAFRHTSVFPPSPHPLAYEKGASVKFPKSTTTCIKSLDLMIQLEGSGNWPLDATAIEKTKVAFLLKIGESLQDRYGITCDASENEVNVLMSGYAFRLKIFHERGLNVLEKTVNNTPSMDKELFICSQHSSMINGLHGRYPTYGPVVRLAKRWVSCHLFSSFLAEEAIELMVAHLFLKPFPFPAPCSRMAGFLRFLRLLADYDWSLSPLIVDINEDFSGRDEDEINENFIQSRKHREDKSPELDRAMFLATTYDKFSEYWTKSSPNIRVLKRMASYARSSAELLTRLILQVHSGDYTWESLFQTPLANYDGVILVHQDKLSYPHHSLFPVDINQGIPIIIGQPSEDFHPYMNLDGGLLKLKDARDKLLIDFDPTLCLLEDLKSEFPNTFKAWYDRLGGEVIGLTWEKTSSKKRGREDDNEETRDPASMLRAVGDVGKGFVKCVYLVKAPRLQP